jgi:putative ubiquitin-RnfH superfamily antitoxin RatB of RatAB toxin-antitoxin module
MQENKSGIEICFGQPAVQYRQAVQGIAPRFRKISQTLSTGDRTKLYRKKPKAHRRKFCGALFLSLGN